MLNPSAKGKRVTLFRPNRSAVRRTKFLLFSALPYELRHIIWRHCIPGTRIVKTRYDILSGRVLPGSAPPALLHVCHESRRFLLSPEMGFSMRFATPEIPGPGAVCINVKTDAVQIDFAALRLRHINAAELEAIVHLELYGASLHYGHAADVPRQLVKFRNLDTLSLLVPPPAPHLPIVVRDRHGHWVLPNNEEMIQMFRLAVSLFMEMKLPEYDAWKKPVLNFLHTFRNGKRSTCTRDYGPDWT
ncbi:hypothetical protein V502_11340 [Pseudogymnoascus sp. VKM F-4520 (FW-2644)]|nr:hypothetical protein V502_11340 [Pseudogymnoascus sp. VKM F-4520 (FW-2644)]